MDASSQPVSPPRTKRRYRSVEERRRIVEETLAPGRLAVGIHYVRVGSALYKKASNRMTLGILELVCTVGLIVPAAFHWQPPLTILAATVLAVESLVFVGVHVKYREVAPTILSGVLGLLLAFIAYGRMVLQPIF